MKKWMETYGEDADGNRGTKVQMFELDDSIYERSDIAELLILKGLSTEDSGSTTVDYEDCEVPITIEEYHEEMRLLEKDQK